MVDSIINHRNMPAVYTVWASLLTSTLVYFALAYWLQYTTPYITTKSTAMLYALIAVGLMSALLAIVFKRILQQEYIAWAMADVIALVGLMAFLSYGWNWWFSIFFITSLVVLLALGPYWHFE
ncbi:MAG: hypothetical protein HYV33_05485 [Candidatus Kerfeldbacteria bacterium]|nr:hypothetical protein [Candidatus Kerfeldbacteria bacterium]